MPIRTALCAHCNQPVAEAGPYAEANPTSCPHHLASMKNNPTHPIHILEDGVMWTCTGAVSTAMWPADDPRPDLCRHCEQPIVISVPMSDDWIHADGFYACYRGTPSITDNDLVADPFPSSITSEEPTMEPVITPPTSVTLSNEPRTTLASVQLELDEVRADRQRYVELAERHREQHRADIAKIGARFNQEAEDRGWCSEYRDVIESLNAELTIELEGQVRPYAVTLTYSVTVHCTVDAVDADEAADEVYNHANESEMFVGYTTDADDNDNQLEYSIGRWTKTDAVARLA